VTRSTQSGSTVWGSDLTPASRSLNHVSTSTRDTSSALFVPPTCPGIMHTAANLSLKFAARQTGGRWRFTSRRSAWNRTSFPVQRASPSVSSGGRRAASTSEAMLTESAEIATTWRSPLPVTHFHSSWPAPARADAALLAELVGLVRVRHRALPSTDSAAVPGHCRSKIRYRLQQPCPWRSCLDRTATRGLRATNEAQGA
jgi:hypothetical protein